MDDLWLRALVIAATLAVAGTWVLLARRGAEAGGGPTRRSSLPPGVYLFTSASCPDCDPARSRLTGALGESGFRELSWEGEPEAFQELEIDAVPTTVIVEPGGKAAVFPGQPEEALARLGA